MERSLKADCGTRVLASGQEAPSEFAPRDVEVRRPIYGCGQERNDDLIKHVLASDRRKTTKHPAQCDRR
ncbi:MAG: hypothetical protein AAF517_27310, partial [Planctomycetota bacterium]